MTDTMIERPPLPGDRSPIRRVTRAYGWGVARLAIATLSIVALATQLIYELQKALLLVPAPAPLTVFGDFVGTFTYWTCALMTLPLVASGVVAIRGSREPTWLRITFIACASNVFFVGLFFNAFLRPTIPPDSIWWINETLHVVLPVYVFVDAVVSDRAPIRTREALAAAIPGAVWTVYTQLRGPFAVDSATGELGWYAYAFTNPNVVPWGTVGAVMVCAVLTGVITGIGVGIVSWTRRREDHAVRS